MIPQGKCPKCEKTLSQLTMEAVPIYQNMTVLWNGVSYLCPHCKTILGASLDPVALKTDTIAGLLLALRK